MGDVCPSATYSQLLVGPVGALIPDKGVVCAANPIALTCMPCSLINGAVQLLCPAAVVVLFGDVLNWLDTA